MNLKDRSIIALWVAVKHQVDIQYLNMYYSCLLYLKVSSSSAMEPYALKTLLLSLIENFQVSIYSLTTDRSSTIKSMMQEDSRLNGIKHCYDVWHWIKRFVSKVTFYSSA